MKITLWDKEVDLDFPNANSFLSDSEIQELEEPLSSFQQKHLWIASVFEDNWLHCRKFVPSDYKEPKAIIVYCHGIQSHSGRALELKGRKLGLALLVKHYVERHGYALYAMDLLGHGYSEGDRAYIPHYQVHEQDLHGCGMLARKSHPHVPLFFMGHSYGATLCLHVTVQHRWQEYNEFAGLLLLSPATEGDMPSAWMVFLLADVLAKCVPKSRPFFMPNPAPPDRIWSDPKVLKLQTTNPLYDKIETRGMPLRLGTAAQILLCMEHLRALTIPRLKSPFCAIHGTHDHVVPMQDMDFLEVYAQTPKEHRTVVRIEGAYHDMLCDRACVHYVLEHLDMFIEKQLTRLHDHLAETLRR